MIHKVIISKELALDEALDDTLDTIEILLLRFKFSNDELIKHVHEAKALINTIHETNIPNP